MKAAALFLALMGTLLVGPVFAQGPGVCLAIQNQRNETVRVTLDAYPDSYWNYAPGEYSYPTFNHEPIRTDSAGHFNMHTDIPGDGNNRFVVWGYHADWTKDGACGNGAWLATIHY